MWCILGAILIGLNLMGVMMYTLYEFENTDYESLTGRLQGDTAFRLATVGAIAAFVSILAIGESMGLYGAYNRGFFAQSKISQSYWVSLSLTLLINISLASMSLHMVNHFGETDLFVSGKRLKGGYADGLLALSILLLLSIVALLGIWAYIIKYEKGEKIRNSRDASSDAFDVSVDYDDDYFLGSAESFQVIS